MKCASCDKPTKAGNDVEAGAPLVAMEDVDNEEFACSANAKCLRNGSGSIFLVFSDFLGAEQLRRKQHREARHPASTALVRWQEDEVSSTALS